MVLLSQFGASTSFRSPPPPSSIYYRRSHSQTIPLFAPGWPPRTFHLSRSFDRFCGTNLGLSISMAAGHSEVSTEKLPYKQSIFLHILENYSSVKRLKSAIDHDTSESDAVLSPTSDLPMGQEGFAKEAFQEPGVEHNDSGDCGGREERELLSPDVQKQIIFNRKGHASDGGGLGFEGSMDGIRDQRAPISNRLERHKSSIEENFAETRGPEIELNDQKFGGKGREETIGMFVLGSKSNVQENLDLECKGFCEATDAGFKDISVRDVLFDEEGEEEDATCSQRCTEHGKHFDRGDLGDAEFREFSEVSGKHQGLKVGRRVFLTDEQDYKRWMPSSELEDQPREFLRQVGVPYSTGPNEVSRPCLQTVDVDESSLENEQHCELQEEEEGLVEITKESGGESSRNLLVEFLKKRKEQWGDDGESWPIHGGNSKHYNTQPSVRDTSNVSKNQTHVPNKKCDTQSAKEFIKEQLSSTPAESTPIGEHLSETPSLLCSDGRHDTPTSLSEEILGITRGLPPNASLETFMTPFCGQISTSDGNLVLKSLGENHFTWPMVSFFQWMRVHNPCLLDSRSFCTLFTHLGTLGMVDQVVLQYKNMPEGRAFHCVQVYNSLLGALSRSKRQEMIPSILQEMVDRNVDRDTVTYTILITATKTGSKDRLDKVWSIFDGMQREGLRPSLFVYGSLIKAFCDEGHLKQALLISVSMEKMGISPNVIIYNTLINAHAKALQLEEAEGLLLEMKEKGFKPTESTYNALINGYGRGGKVDVAEELLLEMKKGGLEPNAFTYTSLISAYGRQKMSEKAANVFSRMKKMGLVPTTHTYTALINAYGEAGWHDKAQRAFDNLSREGLKPTVETYTALLDAYRRAGDLDMVRYLWNTIKEDGCELTRVTYRTIMDAFGKHGFYVEARDVMDEFRKRGMEPDTMIFNILLNACARGGVRTKLQKVLMEMEVAGCQPDSFTYCTLIYSFIRLRDFTSAFKYDKEMVDKGLMPEPKMYWKMRYILDAKHALKLENDKKADSGQGLQGEQQKSKNPQRSKRNFKHYQKQGPRRGSERTKALWKDKEKQRAR